MLVAKVEWNANSLHWKYQLCDENGDATINGESVREDELHLMA